MYRAGRSITSSISGAIVLIGVLVAFVLGKGNLPVFFVFLAFSVLIGSLGTLNPRGVYGGIVGFFWMIILALFFITGSWLWFIVGAVISGVLGTLIKPILAGLLGMGIFNMANQQPRSDYQPQQPYQQPYQQPQPQYQPYQEGYQAPAERHYQEGGQQHTYPDAQPQYTATDQPQAHYPQQMPPQQQ